MKNKLEIRKELSTAVHKFMYRVYDNNEYLSSFTDLESAMDFLNKYISSKSEVVFSLEY